MPIETPDGQVFPSTSELYKQMYECATDETEFEWRWIVFVCNKCQGHTGQTPVRDIKGEDINFWSEIKRYRASLDKCDCGGIIMPVQGKA